jgi:hypothetical protein
MTRIDSSEILAGLDRRIGKYGGEHPGPTVICVGGLHGDEPAALVALRRVFDRLEETRPAFRGELVAFAGNLEALRQHRRYVERDLNRIWMSERTEEMEKALRGGAVPAPADVEDKEQWELFAVLDEAIRRARGEVYFLDLHTSSAQGEPFVCIGDTLRNRSFAMSFPVPVILGLEECIDGSLLEYINNRGAITMGVEAGQHLEMSSADCHEAFIWLALVSAGNISIEDIPGSTEDAPAGARHHKLLQDASGHLPPILEVRYRHPVIEGERFVMEPGYRNFQSIHAGDKLATGRGGTVCAPESGRILLPLYQGLGSDGFFVTQDVRSIWLHVSTVLRRLRLGSVLPYLPGIRRCPERPACLLVDPRIARWLTMDVLHLLGYRKRRAEGDLLVVSRRQYDFRSPFPA